MGKYNKLANEITTLVGGEKNIISLTHCMTRLRFKLKDETAVDEKSLSKLDGVVQVIRSGGQFQVVIGSNVPFVYEEIQKITGFKNENVGSLENEEKGLFNKLIDIISSCFSPMLSILCATGMIKGLNALFIFLNLYSATSGTYALINTIGDSVFYFMPVFLGYNAAKKFSLDPMVGLAIGLSLCYPGIQLNALSGVNPLGNLFGVEYFQTFMGIPFVANNYTGSVLPVLFLVAVAAKIQTVAKKIIPELLQSFFVPFTVLLITLPIGFLTIGPVINVLTNLLGDGLMVVQGWSPVLFSILVAFFWQVLVIFGLHWSLVPIFLMNFSNFGYDYIQPAIFSASFAQTAVILGMYFKLKDSKLKRLCIPAIVSGIFGITEPAIYGISLPKKKPFIISLFGSAIGGAIAGIMGINNYSMGGTGIFGLTTFISPEGSMYSVIWISIAIISSSLFSFLVTLLFWKDEEVTKQESSLKKVNNETKITLVSPLDGKVIPLEAVQDEAFSNGLLGEGVAIIPEDGNIYSPADGKISALFPTNHAVGIIAENGIEILIHIGLDTVELNGVGFKPYVKIGDTVAQGQLLISFDLEALSEKNYILETPIIITNSNSYETITKTPKDSIHHGEDLCTITI